jgi:hypothetical protein
MVKHICLTCKENEEVDAMDDVDPEVPQQYACEGFGGKMYPEYYKGVQLEDQWERTFVS